jgi:hypothetical protein
VVLHYQSIAMCLLLLPKLFGEGMRPQATRMRPSATSVCGLKLLTDAAVANEKLPVFFLLEDVACILDGLAAIYSAARLF